MIEHLPVYIPFAFGLTTLATLSLFIWTIWNSNFEGAKRKSIPIFFGLTSWLVLQAVWTMKAVYSTDTDTFPPKIMLIGIGPTILAMLILFLTNSGREFIDRLPLRHLTYLNIVRVPVELVLYGLFLHEAIPVLMTFEGRNFDILAGITAPIVAYYGLGKQKIGRRALLLWNGICLGLLVNIVINALLSTPSPIQKFAFEQPNIAVLHFPFSWLPTFIVPVVFFGHLASIRKLSMRKED